MKKRRDPLSLILRIAVRAAAALTGLIVLFLVGYILIKGIPHLKPSLFSWKYTSENASMLPALLNTAYMTVLTLLIAAPLGIFAAIFLSEYAKQGGRVLKVIRLAAETLAGIPSIIYGLFGYIVFVMRLQWRYSLLAGVFTLAILVLPLLMRTTEEALLAVPQTYREGAYGLGAGRLRTVLRVVLPNAVPGILAGVILAVGRMIGETAALIFTAGTSPAFSLNPMKSARSLAVHMYNLSSEGLHIDEAYATAVVLLAVVIGINALSGYITRKVVGKNH